MNAEINEMRKLQLQKSIEDFKGTLPDTTVFTVIAGIKGVRGFGVSTNASPSDLRKIGQTLVDLAAQHEEEETSAPKLVTP